MSLSRKNKLYIVVYILISFVIAFFVSKTSYGNEYVSITSDNMNYADARQLGEDGYRFTYENCSLAKGSYQLVLHYAVQNRVKLIININDAEQVVEDLYETENGCFKYDFVEDALTDGFAISIQAMSLEDFHIDNYSIEGNQFINNDRYFYAFVVLSCLLLILIFVVLSYTGKLSIEKQVSFLIISTVVIFVSYPMFSNYISNVGDMPFHLARIEGIKDAYRDGQIIPTIYPNNYNSYGVLGFCYPFLFLIPSTILRLFECSMVAAYQMLIVMINIITAIVTWFAVSIFTKDYRIRNLSVTMMLMAPYRLIDIYQRGAVGEAIGIPFLLLSIAGLYEIVHKDSSKWYYLTIALTGILMAHILSCLFVAMVLVVLVLISIRELLHNRRYVYLILSFVVFIVLNLWYIMPFVKFYRSGLDTSSLKFSVYDTITLVPSRLFMTKASNGVIGFDNTRPILDRGLCTIGLVGVISIIVIVFAYSMAGSGYDKNSIISVLWYRTLVCGLLGACFMTTTLFPWKWLGTNSIVDRIMEVIQFPYRLFAIVTCVICLLTPIAVSYVSQSDELKRFLGSKASFGLVMILTFLMILSSIEILDNNVRREKYILPISGGFCDYQIEDYLPAGVDKSILEDCNTNVENENCDVIKYSKCGTTIRLTVDNINDNAAIVLPLLYYPGYNAIDDYGRRVEVEKSRDGRVCIIIPSDDENIEITVKYSLFSMD